jgi:hypothetical protein
MMLEGLAASWDFKLMPGDALRDKYEVRVKIRDLDGGQRDHAASDYTDIETGTAALYLLRHKFNLPVDLRASFGTDFTGRAGAMPQFIAYTQNQFKRQFEGHIASETQERDDDESSLLDKAEEYLERNGLLEAAKQVTNIQ